MTLLMELSVFWGMIHVIFLFLMLFRSRYTKKKTMLIGCIGMGLLMVINGAGLVIFGLEALGKAFLFTCSVPSFLLFYVLSSDKRFRFLFTFCLADTTCIWIMAATNLLDYYLGGGKYILMFISRLAAFPLLEYCAYRFLRKPYLMLQDAVKKGWGVFAGMTVLYYVLLVVIVNYPTNITNRPEDVFVCVLVLILMFFNYATIFSALYRQLLLYQKQQSERLLQEQTYSLKIQLENQQYIRKMKHDMKGHAVTLSGLLSAGKMAEASKYLKNMESDLEDAVGQFCANPYINAVVGQYVQRLRGLGAEFQADIQIGDEELPYMELCQILSNGLENICDALVKLPQEMREASVRMKYNKDYLIIRMKNRCQKGLQVDRGTLPDSSKGEAGHGFGLLTVKEASERLGGDMVCYTEDGNFILDAMIRLRG